MYLSLVNLTNGFRKPTENETLKKSDSKSVKLVIKFPSTNQQEEKIKRLQENIVTNGIVWKFTSNLSQHLDVLSLFALNTRLLSEKAIKRDRREMQTDMTT